MKSIFKLTFFALIFASSVHRVQAIPFNEAKSLSQIQDTLKVNQDSIVVTVYVSFIVNKKGKVGNVKILKTESDSCSVELLENCKAEALRIVRTMPKWSSAVRKGKRVAVPYILPVQFKKPREELEKNTEN